jgi:hypothetical protein
VRKKGRRRAGLEFCCCRFKIRAHPVNKKVLKGPLKPQLDKKPATVAEPFKLTEVKRKEEVENHKVPNFKAQPLPKSLHNPFKLKATAQPVTEAHTPKFSKRLNKSTPNKVVLFWSLRFSLSEIFGRWKSRRKRRRRQNH